MLACNYVNTPIPVLAFHQDVNFIARGRLLRLANPSKYLFFIDFTCLFTRHRPSLWCRLNFISSTLRLSRGHRHRFVIVVTPPIAKSAARHKFILSNIRWPRCRVGVADFDHFFSLARLPRRHGSAARHHFVHFSLVLSSLWCPQSKPLRNSFRRPIACLVGLVAVVTPVTAGHIISSR